MNWRAREIHPDAERLLSIGNSLDPTRLVEESTVEFLTALRRSFTDFCKVFNAFSESGTRYSEIKIYGTAQTPADFMIFRNQIKLIISNINPGVIQVSYSDHQRGQAPGNLIDEPQQFVGQMGPFRDVFWTFKGDRVEPEQVAKFYFAEFVRITRNSSRSKTSNHLLLEQLKSLLEEKGLDF